jgi:hypothetical protein
MNNFIRVTPSNFQAVNRADKMLRSNLERLAEMTLKYPVECTFAEYRFIFRTRADIEGLIQAIDGKLKEYRRAAASGSNVVRIRPEPVSPP